MKIDIIICTYNRHNKVFNLVNELLKVQIENLGKIIVVDSSDSVNDKFKKLIKVKYIHSSHKNQPYQRYLGFMSSNADLILYLDDDMEMLSMNIFQDLNKIFIDNSVVGLAINFKDKNEKNSLSKVPTSINNKTNSKVGDFFRYISFNSIPKVGQIGLFGLRGKQPTHLEQTSVISGGAFAARRTKFFANFNFQMFDLFEKKMGMGEDTVIGYGLSKMGKVLFYESICFLHNDETGSNYSLDIISYSKRVIYSRLYIALEKARLDRKNQNIFYFKYLWYVFFRILGALISLIIRPEKSKLEVLKGTGHGFFESFKLNYSFSRKRNSYWVTESEKDLMFNKSTNVN
jgi:glycosyltransferase involved in cell wall biosynthesis